MHTLTVGTKAYLDSFTGLVPCVVIEVMEHGVKIRITARKNRSYRCGETLVTSPCWVVPRTAVYRCRIYPYVVSP
jgi:hypothetical protein